MTKIVLVCASGMSTSLLMNKIKSSAEKEGLEVSVSAYSESELEKNYKEADVILLGPQVSFLKGQITSMCEEDNIPVDVVNTLDYGRINGEAVLKQALQLVESE